MNTPNEIQNIMNDVFSPNGDGPSTVSNGMKTNSQGFVLFVALLTSSLLLAVGIAVINLSLKGFLLTTDARESQLAFYAADLGAECALYWDLKADLFSAKVTDPPRTTSELNCNRYDDEGVASEGVNFFDNRYLGGSIGAQGASYNPAGVSFDLFFAPEKYCVLITVKKTELPGRVSTVIESRGYNRYGYSNPDDPVSSKNCTTGGSNVADSHRVERMIEVTY